MTVVQETETVVVERVIHASQQTLFEMWTEADKITTWFSAEAVLDPRPGGIAHLTMGGKVVEGEESSRLETIGHFVVVDPHSHLEFTWGFAQERVGVPPDSSVVAVDFIPQGEGTLVRVTHTGLPAGRDTSPFSERKGWTTMLEHLESAVV
jgi:uncharacterized protein YndB with AHSA1/START domain